MNKIPEKMIKTVTNLDIPAGSWDLIFTQKELRRLASKHGIRSGRYKNETAVNLSIGMPKHGAGTVRFEVKLEI